MNTTEEKIFLQKLISELKKKSEINEEQAIVYV